VAYGAIRAKRRTTWDLSLRYKFRAGYLSTKDEPRTREPNDSDLILEQFDRAAKNFVFPMLDNGYVYLNSSSHPISIQLSLCVVYCPSSERFCWRPQRNWPLAIEMICRCSLDWTNGSTLTWQQVNYQALVKRSGCSRKRSRLEMLRPIAPHVNRILTGETGLTAEHCK
jgi:hypothetical protein